MILVDASVLVAYLRSPSPAVREIFRSVDCAICGVTRAEILHGARTAADAAALREALGAFIQLPIQDQTWDRLGDNLCLLRARGLPMPFQDVLLATVAVEHDAEVWTSDSHFTLMLGVIPGLRLFDGPEP